MQFRRVWMLLSVVLLAAAGCGTGGDAADAPTADKDTVSVVVAPIVVDDVEERIEASAPLQPIHQAVLAAQVAGRVVRKFVGLGQRVKKEAPLLEIDPESYRLALQQAEAQVKSARAAFDKAKNDFARNQKLHQSGDISDFSFEAARVQMAAAEAAYKAAVAARDIARKKLEDTVLRAPFSGRVAGILTDIGSTVSPGMPLVRLVDIRRFKVKVGVSERDITRLQKGTHCEVSFDAYPGVKFEGKVAALGPQAEAPSRTFPVEIELANDAKHPLRAGMVAQVKILLRRYKQVPLVPLSALVNRRGKMYLYTAQGSTAREHEVTLGPQRDQSVAVLAGLPDSGEVIVLGQDQLRDGSPIKVVRRERSRAADQH